MEMPGARHKGCVQKRRVTGFVTCQKPIHPKKMLICGKFVAAQVGWYWHRSTQLQHYLCEPSHVNDGGGCVVLNSFGGGFQWTAGNPNLWRTLALWRRSAKCLDHFQCWTSVEPASWKHSTEIAEVYNISYIYENNNIYIYTYIYICDNVYVYIYYTLSVYYTLYAVYYTLYV